MFCEQSAARVMSGKEKHNISRQILLSVWDSWSEYQHLQVVPQFLCGDTICDAVAKMQSGDKISKCNQHFLAASKSQGVDKICLWCQNSKVVPNCLCGFNPSYWCQNFFVVPKFQSGAMSSSEEKLTDDEILAAHKILPLCGQPRLTMMTMKSNYFTRIRL